MNGTFTDPAVILAVISLIGTIILAGAQVRSARMGATDKISNAAVTLIEPLEKRIKLLEVSIIARDLRITELERQVAEIPTLKAEIAQLHRENADLRIKLKLAQDEKNELRDRIREIEKRGTGPLHDKAP